MRASKFGQRAALWTLVLLVVPVVTTGPVLAADDCQPFMSVEVPSHVGADGTPFSFRYTPAACHDDTYDEVRLWLGDTKGDTQASRAWDGESWTSSTRYIPLPPTRPDGDIWPALQANPDATHADALLTVGGEATVWGQWRGPDHRSGPLALGAVTLLGSDHVRAHWTHDDRIIARDTEGRLVAAAPTGLDADGRPQPAGFGHAAFPTLDAHTTAAPPRTAGAILLQRLAPALAPESWDLIELHVTDPDLDDLQGLRIGDGEGWLVLPPTPVPPSRVVQLVGPGAADMPTPWTQNGDALRLEWSKDRGTPWSRAETIGSFALAKGGESIWLHYGDTVLDTFVYGDPRDDPRHGWHGDPVEATRIDGRVFVRGTQDGTLVDTDTADDWTHPRIHRQHQLDRHADWFDANGPVRAFVCPERCWEEILLRIEHANNTIDVNLYDLTLTEAVEALAAAATRGVDVRLLLHGRPVAASRDHMDRLAWAVERLTASGVDVRVHDGLRFDVNHAKYLVVDGTWSVVSSENAVASGWSPSGTGGNRGWGIAVADTALADWMSALFHADFAHPVDSHAATAAEFSTDPRPGFAGARYAADHDRTPTLVVDGPVRVRPVVAPEHLGDPTTSPLVAALTSARHEIWTQQLNLPLEWKRPGYYTDSPLVSALQGAALRNVTVLGTLADAFEDGDPDTPGNDRTATRLSTSTRIDMRLGAAPGGGTIHNKGWLVDGVPSGRNLVIIGSANGNLASQAMNREVNVMIEDPRIAQYYRAVLVADQARAHALGPSLLDTPERGTAEAHAAHGVVLVLIGLACAARSRRRHD